jgi:diaminopimelate epimerase
MSLSFTKMHGLGNDFVVIDATQEKFNLSVQTIQNLGDRHTGIGFDQLLVIESSADPKYDFRYRIFNANGEEVEQCGNGARCVAHYIFSEKLSRKKKLLLATLSGQIELTKEAEGKIRVNMGVPQFAPEKIPFVTPQLAPQYELILDGHHIQFGAVSLGNPHAVIQVKDVNKASVAQIGQRFQHHPAFPKQVNVGFMEIVSPSLIRLRVFERGVGETRSCGSGACAAVAIGRMVHDLAPEVKVELPGGNLTIAWALPSDNLYMTGPAQTVFKGQLVI